MTSRDRVRRWIPLALLEARRRRLGHGVHFTDAPADWAHALALTSGYSAATIRERVAAATREVVAGRAAYERDSVLFQEPAYPFPIVAQLLRAALANGRRLNVIDFGGSLGSTYRQCRPLLDGVQALRWHVIEQPGFVAIGRNEFGTEELRFATSPDDVPVGDVPPLVLLSSVLQYLEAPESTLRQLLDIGATHLIIDRTPMSALDTHRLCIQHVPKSIYDASYPCWVLSRTRLLEMLSRAGWRVMAEFDGLDGAFATPSDLRFTFRGLIAEHPRGTTS